MLKKTKRRAIVAMNDDHAMHKAWLAEVLPANATCAFCDSAKPRWATLPLGALVCIECAGLLRVTHNVSVVAVRSVLLDSWNESQRSLVTGNALVLRWWAAFGMGRPAAKTDFGSDVARLFRDWKAARRVPAQQRPLALALLQNKGTDDARELLWTSFAGEWGVFATVLPNRVRRVLHACALCFLRLAALDRHLRCRLACEIVRVMAAGTAARESATRQ